MPVLYGVIEDGVWMPETDGGSAQLQGFIYGEDRHNGAGTQDMRGQVTGSGDLNA
jgi:hypothetical protein